jgi:hypothetical protein
MKVNLAEQLLGSQTLSGSYFSILEVLAEQSVEGLKLSLDAHI